MPVIINQLELVVDAPQQPLPQPAPRGGTEVQPVDINDVVDKREEYDLRTFAH